MKNIIILFTCFLLLSVCSFLISCDDFFSPVIQIFNEIETPVNTEQDNIQNNKKDTNINQQQL